MSKKYQIIYADPPWKYKNVSFGKRPGDNKQTLQQTYSSSIRYGELSLEELCILPIKNLSDKNCVLFLWVTAPMLQTAFELLKSWGFIYKTMAFVWIKTTQLQKGRPGSKDGWLKKNLGKWTLSSAEFVLLATKGSLKPITKTIRQVGLFPIEYHSKKPDKFREEIVDLMGNLPRIELFAREKTEGWDVWGNEVESDIEL